MKLFKRIVASLLGTTMCLSMLAACQSNNDNAGDQASADGAWKPTSNINIRVPFKAGGSADTIARIAAKGLEKSYGQTVVVNNLTGANGAIAATDLLGQKADPTEMMLTGITLFTLAPLFNQDIQLNLDDFEIVGSLASEDFVVLSNPAKTGIKTFEDLMEYGKTNKVISAANTAGGTTHMLSVALFGEAGITSEVLSDDGGAQNALAVASGDATVCVVSSNAAQQFVEEGTLVPLACFSEEDFTGYTGYTVPTVKSKGFDIVFKSCNFLMTRKGVDKAILDQIYQEILAYRNTDEFKELASSATYIPDTQNGDEVRATIEASAELCKEIYDKYYAK